MAELATADVYSIQSSSGHGLQLLAVVSTGTWRQTSIGRQLLQFPSSFIDKQRAIDVVYGRVARFS